MSVKGHSKPSELAELKVSPTGSCEQQHAVILVQKKGLSQLDQDNHVILPVENFARRSREHRGKLSRGEMPMARQH